MNAFLSSCSNSYSSSSKNILPRRVSRNNLPSRLQQQNSSSNLLNSLDVIERSDSHELIGQDYSIIRKGGIYIQHDFITAVEVTTLQNDIKQLYKSNQFMPSGLSNRVEGDKNEFGEEDRLTCTITPILLNGDDSFIRQIVEEKLEALKHELEENVFQENAVDGIGLMERSHLDLAEMYYSISPKGSILPRHQDERHEDTKGEKGWMHDTRRSISWLIYLNNDWYSDSQDASGGGGQFRAYCRKCIENVQCGSHDGNLQIGWLSSSSIENNFEPVFLDSWVQMPTAFSDDADEILYDEEEPGYEQLKWCPVSALYRVRSDSDDVSNIQDLLNSDSDSTRSLEIKYPNREYLSQPFGVDSPGWPKETELDPSDFIQALASQLSDESIRQRFVGLEEIKGQGVNIVDVEPTAGTLVLFDSVLVPHEVLTVTSGERLAIAGWFHESVQAFPDWYGT